MTGYEIVILIAGLIFVVASFFFGGKDQTPEPADVSAQIRKIKEAAVLHENEVRDHVREIVENESAVALANTQDMLSKISNDKIIAIDEYASQVLERIENNNQSVVFLYDMLQKKEDEMKSTMNKMEQTRRENRELFNRLEELKQAKARVSGRGAAKQATRQTASFAEGMEDSATADPGMAGADMMGARMAGTAMTDADIPAVAVAEKSAATRAAKAATGKQTAAMVSGKQTVVRNEMPQGTLELEHTQAGALTEAMRQGAEKGNALPANVPAENRQEMILSMYREHKTVKEISKQLSMGQGEVKLIIDLYAKKSE